MYIVLILAWIVIAVMYWIDNLSDKKQPSYVRQIDLSKWSKK